MRAIRGGNRRGWFGELQEIQQTRDGRRLEVRFRPILKKIDGTEGVPIRQLVPRLEQYDGVRAERDQGKQRSNQLDHLPPVLWPGCGTDESLEERFSLSNFFWRVAFRSIHRDRASGDKRLWYWASKAWISF